jgi:CDP-4-dehydro-6-deoxyglucose reductase
MRFRVQWIEGDTAFTVEPGESVLDAALRQQVALPHDCRFGGCGSCRIRLLDGRVRYEEPPFALSPEDEARGEALACQAQPLSDLVLSVAPPLVCSPPTRARAVVERIAPLGSQVLHLQLRLPEDLNLVWAPGQYMNVLLQGERHRSFSMASRPDGALVDFHVRRISGGHFTEQMLAALRPGDALDVEVPLGQFRYHAQDERPIAMLATGTGLAPLKAMLESLMDDDDCPPISLYWGARDEADLYLHTQIEAWGERLYEFRYVPVLSRAGHAWAGRRGHVQQALLDDLDDLSEHAVYLCGSPLMVADARRAVLARGASAEHLYSDSFTFQQA